MHRSHNLLEIARPRTRGIALTACLVLFLAGSLALASGPSGLGPRPVKAERTAPNLVLPAGDDDTMIHSAFLPAIRTAIKSPRPIVVHFAATPPHVENGSSTTLSWHIRNAVDTLTLEPGIGDVTGRDSIVVSPSQTTAYTLTARNQAGTTSVRTVVTVGRPVIARFTASPTLIYQGGQATLSWSILGHVDRLTLEPGIGDITNQTQFIVSPSQDTVYTLTAYNSAGNDTAQVEVTVAPPPEITSFDADPEAINDGDDAMLIWTISGTVQSLILEPGHRDVTGQNQVNVSPTETTTYTLNATNGSGSDVATSLVRVSPATELLVFDWNEPVEKSDSGFPGERPEGAANDNWTHPPNFAEGTYHFRVEIHSQPVTQEDMQVQYCVWQKIDGEAEQREACAERIRDLDGSPGTKATWSHAIDDMWSKYEPINYAVERKRHGAVIRNNHGDPVSGKQDWNWSGEIPEEWYPLDWRFTVVIVAKGETFSGWGNYLEP